MTDYTWVSEWILVGQDYFENISFDILVDQFRLDGFLLDDHLQNKTKTN